MQKLSDTKAYRRKLLKDPNVNIIECFPYFFVNTDLVSLRLKIHLRSRNTKYERNMHWNASFRDQILLDFEIQFKLPGDVFMKKWNAVKDNIKQVHSESGFDSNEIPVELGVDIEPMLLLLQMLPDVPKGKKSSKKRLTFVESVKKLVIFSPVTVWKSIRWS